MTITIVRNHKKYLPCNVSASPEENSALRKLVNLLSLSDWRVCTMSPTGNGNITLSTECAIP